MLRLNIFLLITVLGLSTSAQYTATVRTSVVKLENASWRNWTSENCTINYPGEWTQELGGLNGMRALFMAPADSATQQRGRMEVQMVDRDGRSLETVASMTMSELGERFRDVKEQGQSSEGDVLVREYSVSMNGTTMRIKRQFRVHGERVFVLTYMAEPRHYEESLYLADAMFASFTTK